MTDHIEDPVQGEDEHPRGALAILLFYMLVIVGVWVYTYAILLSRN